MEEMNRLPVLDRIFLASGYVEDSAEKSFNFLHGCGLDRLKTEGDQK